MRINITSEEARIIRSALSARADRMAETANEWKAKGFHDLFEQYHSESTKSETLEDKIYWETIKK